MKPYNEKFEPTTTGIFDIPEAEYRLINALNNSNLKFMDERSPRHLQHRLQGGTGKPIGTATKNKFDFGNAVDKCLFEPDRFEKEVIVSPDWSKNSNKYKEWRAEQPANAILVKPAEHARVLNAVAALKMKPKAVELLASGYPQKTLLWKHPEYGFWCKGRPDWIATNGIVVDLKTTESGWLRAFRRIARNLKYYWQASWYMQGLSELTGENHNQWRWLVSEIYPPHESCVYIADEMGLAKAETDIAALCAIYNDCLESGMWPGYPDEMYLGNNSGMDYSIEEADIPF